MLRLAEMRKKRNMTQMALARAVGIAQPSISDMENGNTNPTLENLIKIAKVLECSLDDLVDMDAVTASAS